MATFGKNWVEDSKDDFEPINAFTHWKEDEKKEDVSIFSKLEYSLFKFETSLQSINCENGEKFTLHEKKQKQNIKIKTK